MSFLGRIFGRPAPVAAPEKRFVVRLQDGETVLYRTDDYRCSEALWRPDPRAAKRMTREDAERAVRQAPLLSVFELSAR